VPLMWTLLTHQGNSNTEQRIALMKRYLALFSAASIQKVSACRSQRFRVAKVASSLSGLTAVAVAR